MPPSGHGRLFSVFLLAVNHLTRLDLFSSFDFMLDTLLRVR
jgi:hypothetical protein